MYILIGAETSRATKIESSVSSAHSGSLKLAPAMMSSSTVTMTVEPESSSNSVQVTPDMPTETLTMGVRVGASVGNFRTKKKWGQPDQTVDAKSPEGHELVCTPNEDDALFCDKVRAHV